MILADQKPYCPGVDALKLLDHLVGGQPARRILLEESGCLLTAFQGKQHSSRVSVDELQELLPRIRHHVGDEGPGFPSRLNTFDARCKQPCILDEGAGVLGSSQEH